MRFRRSVRICKGVHLNFSGSGVSMSLGMRGASVTLGESGIYANYGLPGTGIYNRVKLASPVKKQGQTHSQQINLSNYKYNINSHNFKHSV